MFFEILDQSRQNLLKKIVMGLPVQDSYLAGGTGLALLLGHRESIDFDWFTPTSFDLTALSNKLMNIGNVRIAETSSGTFHGWVDHIQVTWLRYPNPLVDELVSFESMPGLKIASLQDIAVMKWAAISDRGSKKDFIDLYWICQTGTTLESLVPLLSKKFPNANINYYHMIKSLAYFEDADHEANPVMLKPMNWLEIKEFFKLKQRDLLKRLF